MTITCTPDELGLRLLLTPDNGADVTQLNSVEAGTQAVFVEKNEPGQLVRLEMTLRVVRPTAAPEPVVEPAPAVDAPKEVVPVAPEPVIVPPHSD